MSARVFTDDFLGNPHFGQKTAITRELMTRETSTDSTMNPYGCITILVLINFSILSLNGDFWTTLKSTVSIFAPRVFHQIEHNDVFVVNTVGPRSLDPFYIVSYSKKKWAMTTWT